jgi:excisionase family DNA binding protein
MERVYSVPEAAKALGGISPWTLRAWLSRGWLQRTKLGRRTMISERELERFVKHGGNPVAKPPNGGASE